MTKRYVRGTSTKVKRLVASVNEGIKKAKRVSGFPEYINCKVCYAKKVSIDNAVHVLGGGGNGRSYYMCQKHLS